MNQKKLNMILMIASIFFAVVAVVLLIVGIVYDGDHTLTKVLMLVIAFLSFALAAELFYLRWLSVGGKTNYFLYDTATKRNISVEQLNAQTVHAKMNRYFSAFAPSEGKLWTDGILDSPELDIADEFKPIVAYKLLFDLADRDMDKGWKCFEAASVQTVDFICRGLELNDENEFAENIRKMKEMHPFQIQYVRDYLVKNKDYMQTKMLMYVRNNISKFE